MANVETTRNRGPAVPDSPAPGGGAAGAGSFPAEAKLLLIQEQARTGEPLRRFCAAHGITTTTFCAWKRRYEAEGAAGLEPRPNPRNASGAHRGAFPPEQRREAVQAWLRSGMRQADFARLWGVGKSSLSKWIRRYQEGGPQALEDQPRRRPCPQRLPAAVHEEIVRTKRAHPFFGLRKVRDFLYRFRSTRVSAATVARTLKAADLARVIRVVPTKWKAWRAARCRRRRTQQRVSVLMARRDAVWCVDATQLGRVAGERVHGITLRDLGSRRTLALSVGGAPCGRAVVELLERARRESGVLPYVVCSDNGSENVNWEMDAWLERHGVIRLRTLPYTPQHNAWAERGMAELKGAAGIGKRAVFANLEDADELLLEAWLRTDRATPRREQAWRTRERGYRSLESCYTPEGHEAFYRTARSAAAGAVRGASTARARQRAERGAIYATLENYDLIRRTRGGVPLGRVEGEGVS